MVYYITIVGVRPVISHNIIEGISNTVMYYKNELDLPSYYYAEKPNHNLTYSIGSNFCIEDPVNTPFIVAVVCPLANEPQPPPEFRWSIFYNTSTEVDLHGLPSLQIFNESDILNLSGTIELGEGVSLTITCTVNNQYDNDTENTLISLCGMKAQCTHA